MAAGGVPHHATALTGLRFDCGVTAHTTCFAPPCQAFTIKREQPPPAATLHQATGGDLARLVECEHVHAHLPALLTAAFEGAPDETYVPRLDPVARRLIGALAADALPTQVAKRCTDWLISELEHFDTKTLLDLVEVILGGLKATLRSSAGGGTTKPHVILPKCLGLLATVDKCCITLKDGNEVHNGAQVVEYAVRSLVKAPWHASAVTGMAETLREVALEKPARRDLLTKMLRKLDDVELTQLPALVYQLLLLSDAECKPLVLGELNAHFQRLLDSCAQGTPLVGLAPHTSTASATRVCYSRVCYSRVPRPVYRLSARRGTLEPAGHGHRADDPRSRAAAAGAGHGHPARTPTWSSNPRLPAAYAPGRCC
jgi:hypothetical protein